MSQRACGVCGAPCRPPFRAPAAELAPDLDGRPGEPARSTLNRWIATCRRCGAAAPDLGACPAAARELVGSDAYRALGSPFLRWAAIAAQAGQTQAAAEATLQAAWVCDDAGEDATALRLQAAALWTQADRLRLLDVYRRAGAFPQATELADSLGPLDADSGTIVAFQRDRIRQGDTGRHMIGSALRPPARTPHAAQGRTAAKPGVWARLFRR